MVTVRLEFRLGVQVRAIIVILFFIVRFRVRF